MSFGVTGGHFQPAGQLQIVTNIVDYGLSVQSAIDHPRMFALGDVFEIEQTVPQETGIGSRKLRPCRHTHFRSARDPPSYLGRFYAAEPMVDETAWRLGTRDAARRCIPPIIVIIGSCDPMSACAVVIGGKADITKFDCDVRL